MATYEEPRFTFHKPVSDNYSKGYDLIFGKKCKKKCSLDNTGVCSGCLRTIEEIKNADKR